MLSTFLRVRVRSKMIIQLEMKWIFLEIRTAVKKLKHNKSPYSDKIRHDMIKASLNEMMPVYHKLFNNILNGGSMPPMWSSGLITPILSLAEEMIQQITAEFLSLLVV